MKWIKMKWPGDSQSSWGFEWVTVGSLEDAEKRNGLQLGLLLSPLGFGAKNQSFDSQQVCHWVGTIHLKQMVCFRVQICLLMDSFKLRVSRSQSHI